MDVTFQFFKTHSIEILKLPTQGPRKSQVGIPCLLTGREPHTRMRPSRSWLLRHFFLKGCDWGGNATFKNWPKILPPGQTVDSISQ